MTADRVLPDGWRWVQFGDVVRQVKRTTKDPETDGLTRIVGLEHLDSESLPLRRWSDLADLPDGTSFTRIFRAGQVLFGKRRAYQRKVAVADFDGVCSGDILVFESSTDGLLPRFLPYVVQSDGFFNHALGTSAGSLSPRTKWQDLAGYGFALPPAAEQAKIVELLKTTDDAINTYGTVIDAGQKFIDALAANLVRAHQDRQVPLGEVGDVQYGLTLSPKRRGTEKTGPYLRVANVQRGRIDLEEIKEVGLLPNDHGKYALREGDLLVVEGHANINEIGRTAMWRGEVSGMLHQNHLIRVRCADGMRPRVALALLNSPLGTAYFKSRAKSTSGLNTLNSTVVSEFPMPVLEDEVQADTERKLNAADALMEQAQQSVRLLTLARRALAEDLLHGETDV